MKLKRGDTLILASHNQGKLEEFKTFLSLYDLNINSSGNLGIEEPEETENTFEGNAVIHLLVHQAPIVACLVTMLVRFDCIDSCQ